MVLYIDVPWLLDVQEQAVPEDVTVADYSALVAAIARHKTRIPRPTTAEPDAAWRAAALLHTLVRLQPLPYRNSLYACQVAAAYMHASGEGIDPHTVRWWNWSATSSPARPTSTRQATTSAPGASDGGVGSSHCPPGVPVPEVPGCAGLVAGPARAAGPGGSQIKRTASSTARMSRCRP